MAKKPGCRCCWRFSDLTSEPMSTDQHIVKRIHDQTFRLDEPLGRPVKSWRGSLLTKNFECKLRPIPPTAAQGGRHISRAKAKHRTYSTCPIWWWTQIYGAARCPVLCALGYSCNICGKYGWRRNLEPFCDEFLGTWLHRLTGRLTVFSLKTNECYWLPVRSRVNCNAWLTTQSKASCSSALLLF